MSEQKKMGAEATIEEVEKKIGGWPGTTIQRYVVAVDDLNKYGLRKRSGMEQSHCTIWALGVGQYGQQLTWFYGYKLLDVAKKAHEWAHGTPSS